MRRTAPLLLATLLAACQDLPTVPPSPDASLTPRASRMGDPEVLKDRYIVLVNERTDPEQLGRATTSASGGRLHFAYRHALHGFAATLPAPAVEALRNNPNVTRIEPDLVVHVVGSGSASAASWGLDRIDQRSGLDGTYNWTTSGAGVTVYILDTGIRFSHVEFGGRAQPGFDAIGDGQNGNDCHGHGTHVAGTVGGATYGVAKDVTLVSVRVLGCNGSGSFSGVIAGVDWVTANHSGSSVANMSLGAMDLFGTSTSVDKAVRNSISSGVSYALAAGNDAFDACYYTPARVAEAMTVGATDLSDFRAYFSNYGSCVDWFAPGVSILSAWNSSDDATNSISGTSMATPHTAGVAALYLELQPEASPAAVRSALYDASTKGIVADAFSANNHLVYSRLDGSEPPPPPGNQPPVASFTVSCDGLTCNFSDQSTDADGTLVARSWAFGDGATSTAQSPSHTYAAEGTYGVSLTVTDDDGATSATSQSVTVTAANQPPAAAFTYSCTDLTCTFTDQSTDSDGTVISWLWEFGDGEQAFIQHPTHTFGAAGTYTVALTAIDDDLATGRTTRDVTVGGGATNQPPIAAFTQSCTDLTCSFTDGSADGDGTLVAWSWTFGDGGTSTTQSPSHTYAADGTYTVSLMVTDDDGAPSATSQSVTVTAPNQPPTAAFTHACTDLTCTFTDQSTDADGTLEARNWSFGDGGTSAAQSPSHTYAAAGTYTVSLTVTDDDAAAATTSQQVTVTQPPTGGPTVSACSPAGANANDQLVVQVTGSGFQSGATADFGDRIMVQKADFVNSSLLEFRIKVHAKAASGARAVTVRNPDGQFGTNAGCFTVN